MLPLNINESGYNAFTNRLFESVLEPLGRVRKDMQRMGNKTQMCKGQASLSVGTLQERLRHDVCIGCNTISLLKTSCLYLMQMKHCALCCGRRFRTEVEINKESVEIIANKESVVRRN
jgi:hypothetical protein